MPTAKPPEGHSFDTIPTPAGDALVMWDAAGALMLETPEGTIAVRPRACILALGGASWPKLGADGSWVGLLAAQGIDVAPLRPANCGFLVPWSDLFRDRFAGQPLKRIALSFRGQVVRGEGMITRQPAAIASITARQAVSGNVQG